MPFRKPSQQQAGQPIASFWGLHRIILGVLMELFSPLVCCHKGLGCAQSLSHVSTSWTEACQAPLSMGILQARILEWVTMPSSKGSSQPRSKSRSPTLQADSLPTEPPGKQTWEFGVYFPYRCWRREWQSTPVFLPGRITCTEEPGWLQSSESQRVR